MSFVTTAAVVGIGATAIGTGISVYGAERKGKADQAQALYQAQQAQYQAAIADMNRKIALQNADYDIAAGETKAQQSGMQTRAQIGEAKVTQAASGLDVNTGSAVDVRESIADIGAENTGIVRANAARAAYGEQVNAANATAQSTLYTNAASGDIVAGNNAREAGDIGALSSLIGGAASVATKWSAASTAGVFGGTRAGWVGDSGHSAWIDNPDAK